MTAPPRPGSILARLLILFVVLMGPFVLMSGRMGSAQGTPVATERPPCEVGNADSWQQQMDAYAQAGDFPAVQTSTGGNIESVLVELPAIELTGDEMSPTLPVGPCQTIYRFQYSDIQAPADSPQTFSYVEIDWNTEGEPRGPNGAFASAHFDFHFYLPSREEIENNLACISTNGKTCDGFQTDYAQMRRFQNMPEADLVPELYRPDVGSAIPAMGLHHLDMTQSYTVHSVNHYPVLIYGTFDGKIVFAEASVTLFTLQDVMASPDHRLAFEFRQPESFASEIDWPTEFVIEYLPDSGGFRAGFAKFVHQAPEG